MRLSSLHPLVKEELHEIVKKMAKQIVDRLAQKECEIKNYTGCY